MSDKRATEGTPLNEDALAQESQLKEDAMPTNPVPSSIVAVEAWLGSLDANPRSPIKSPRSTSHPSPPFPGKREGAPKDPGVQQVVTVPPRAAAVVKAATKGPVELAETPLQTRTPQPVVTSAAVGSRGIPQPLAAPVISKTVADAQVQSVLITNCWLAFQRAPSHAVDAAYTDDPFLVPLDTLAEEGTLGMRGISSTLHPVYNPSIHCLRYNHTSQKLLAKLALTSTPSNPAAAQQRLAANKAAFAVSAVCA